MNNYLAEGKTMTFVAPSGGVVAGTGYIIGSIFCIAQASVAEGSNFEGLVEGLVKLPKSSAVFSDGEIAYWDNTAKQCKESATGYYKIGVARAAVTGASTVEVKLNGVDTVAVS